MVKKVNCRRNDNHKKDSSGLFAIIDRFRNKKICVVGDIIADVFIYGKPYRLSREAPVVVIKHEDEVVCPGSAGNTINNLLALGAYVYPLGYIGNDSAGERIMEYFGRFKDIELGRIIRYDGCNHNQDKDPCRRYPHIKTAGNKDRQGYRQKTITS